MATHTGSVPYTQFYSLNRKSRYPATHSSPAVVTWAGMNIASETIASSPAIAPVVESTPVSPDIAARHTSHTVVSLLILIGFNAALVWGVRAWGTSARVLDIGLVLNGMMYGQMLLLCLIAALWPQSWIMPVVVTCVLALVRNLLLEPAIWPDMVLVDALTSILLPLTYLATFYPLRVFLGWRIHERPLIRSLPAQFRLQDLFICTILVSLACGVGVSASSANRDGISSRDIVFLLGEMAIAVLVGTPISLVLLSTKRIKLWHATVIVALIVLSFVGWLAWEWLFHHRYFDRMFSHLIWHRIPIFFAALSSTAAANALILRRLRFRWQ